MRPTYCKHYCVYTSQQLHPRRTRAWILLLCKKCKTCPQMIFMVACSSVARERRPLYFADVFFLSITHFLRRQKTNIPKLSKAYSSTEPLLYQFLRSTPYKRNRAEKPKICTTFRAKLQTIHCMCVFIFHFFVYFCTIFIFIIITRCWQLTCKYPTWWSPFYFVQIQSQQFLKGSRAPDLALLGTIIAHPLASSCDVATICEIRSV